MKIKPISKSSWILLNENNTQVGLLTFNTEYNLLYNKEKHSFQTEDEVNKFFDCNLFENIVANKDTTFEPTTVKGFPTDLNNVVVVDDATLPLYTKNDKSKVVYAAGYYCIKYTELWTQAFCPKAETLSKYTYNGPFKNKMEMRLKLNQLNKNV
jgi:hypothetical protein